MKRDLYLANPGTGPYRAVSGGTLAAFLGFKIAMLAGVGKRRGASFVRPRPCAFEPTAWTWPPSETPSLIELPRFRRCLQAQPFGFE